MNPSKPSRGVLEPDYVPDPGSIWIDENRSGLPDNEWVAANEHGKVATSASIEELLALVKMRGIDPGRVAIAFISSGPI